MKDYRKILDDYCNDILSGKIPAGRYTVKAVKRFISDLKKSEKGKLPFVYMQEEADKVLVFTEMLKPADLNGKRIELLPWQVFCLSNLEGWRHRDDLGRKRYRGAYIEVNRKNGKTTGLLLPLVIYNFLKYPASESYIVSSRDDLAEKTFKEVQDIIRADSLLDDVLECRSLAITFRDINEKARLAFFCDGGKSADGFKPRFYCIDEYHEYATDKIVESMRMGMRSKKDAQGVIITTADTETGVPCYEQHLKAKRILDGIQTQDDFFTVIYALDEGDDYHNPDVWIKANPSLYIIIDPSAIQSDVDEAELTPHKKPELKAKTFGIWGGGGEKSWLSMETWQKNAGIVPDWESLNGEECYGGLDLSQVDDLTAFTLCFKKKDGKFWYKHRFYIPEDTVHERYRKENINFIQWVESGIITAVPGATIDYSFIARDILEDAAIYRIRGIGYDRWQSREVITAIEEARPDIALVEIEQSLKKLSPLTQAYEKSIKDGLVIDNNPVMQWMVGNVQVKPDVNGNYKPLKKSKASTQRIDGVISAIMAYGTAINPAFQSVPFDISGSFR